MISRPTTEQILDAVRRALNETVLPRVTDEPARIAISMMSQMLAGCAVRSAHEIAWMHDEMTAIELALADASDDETVAALNAYRESGSGSLHLADVSARYHLVSEALACSVEHAYATDDRERVAALRELLRARCANEMAILGNLDLVGRG